MRVGFVLNHYATHQVPHVVPTAFALSKLRPEWTVEILCSTAAELEFASEIGLAYPGHCAGLRRLKVPLSARLADPLLRQFAFYRKRAVQSANVDLFSRCDALVVPEVTSLALKQKPQMAGVKLIFTGHGAGDGRKMLIGHFDPKMEQFDLVLLPGRKLAEEMLALGRFRTKPYAISGYTKFELTGQQQRLFNNDRPTVLYTPTQHPDATSWHEFGPAVLDYFYASDTYNLIFAPHVLLFQRAWSRGARLPGKYRSTDTVMIDTGSRASVDMTYINAADIYLGDLSSQVYEFIEKPRPCVFLDPVGVDYKDNLEFLSWSFGPVIRSVADLDAGLQTARKEFNSYRPIQETVRDYNFVQSSQSASERGAEILSDFLETGKVDPRWL